MRRAWLLVGAMVACGSRPTQTLVARVDSPGSSAVPDDSFVAPASSTSASATAISDEVPDVAIAIDPPARPMAQKYVPSRAPSPGTLACKNEKEPSKEALCIRKTSDEAGIARLLEIAKKWEWKREGRDVSGFDDHAGAADQAGVIAAKTSETELFAMLRDPDPSTEGFALRALAHMLSILRMGYANGYDTDNARRVPLAPRVADECAPLVVSTDMMVALTALRCMHEAGGARHAPFLARVVAVHPSPKVKAEAASAYAGSDIALPVARKIARFVETPMNDHWYVEDVYARNGACWLLRRAVPSRPSWIGVAAGIAVREFETHGRGNANDGACKRVAEEAGTVAKSPPPQRDWFPTTAIERCRGQKLGAMGQVMVCARNAPAGERARSWSIVVTDPSQLEDAQHHKLVARYPLTVDAGSYVDVDHVEQYELSNGFFVFMVPITHGTPDSYSDSHVEIHLLDTNARTLTFTWKSRVCNGCTTQTVQIASRPGQVARTVTVLQYKDIDQPRTTDLKWDGATLR